MKSFQKTVLWATVIDSKAVTGVYSPSGELRHPQDSWRQPTVKCQQKIRRKPWVFLPRFLPGSLGTVMSFIKMGSWRRELFWKQTEWIITVYVNYCLATRMSGAAERMAGTIIISTFCWARTMCQVCVSQSAYVLFAPHSPRRPLWPVFPRGKTRLGEVATASQPAREWQLGTMLCHPGESRGHCLCLQV